MDGQTNGRTHWKVVSRHKSFMGTRTLENIFITRNKAGDVDEVAMMNNSVGNN